MATERSRDEATVEQSPDAAVAERARVDAARAAEASGIVVRTLDGLTELAEAIRVVDDVWRPAAGEPLLTVELLRALSHSDNYVAGAFGDVGLVGVCVGFLGHAPDVTLHSHIAGISVPARGRGVGYALKLHQRAWALDRGLTQITWTTDPLIRRNAYFNLVKLAAHPVEYVVDFYGEIDDAINAGQGTDRLLLHWDLASSEVATACRGDHSPPRAADLVAAVPVLVESESGRPLIVSDAGSAGMVLVATPTDIEVTRRTNPELGRRWRHAVRDVLGDLLDSGWRVTGFALPGSFVVERDVS